MCCVPAICSSSLPGQGSRASGAGNLPRLSFLYKCLCWRLAYTPLGRFISKPRPLRFRTSLSSSQRGLCGFSLNTPPGSKPHLSLTALDKADTGCLVWQGFTPAHFFSEHSAPRGAPLLGEVRGPVSTRHPRCALSRRPEGGGCDGGSGVGSGSGRTCDSGGLQSEVGCPGPSPRRGCLRPPPLTRGRCCTEGSRCLPAGSWCCNLGKEQHSLRTQSRLSRRLGCTPVLATPRCQHLHVTRC